jgi:hypothetical protein
VFIQHFTEEFFIGAAQHAIKATSSISLLNLPWGELFFVSRHGG